MRSRRRKARTFIRAFESNLRGGLHALVEARERPQTAVAIHLGVDDQLATPITEGERLGDPTSVSPVALHLEPLLVDPVSSHVALIVVVGAVLVAVVHVDLGEGVAV